MADLNAILRTVREYISGSLVEVGGRSAALFLIAIGIGLAAAGPVNGYVLQGPQLLDLMARTLSGGQTLRVEQQVTIEDSAVADRPVEFNETLSYTFPDQFRSDTAYENTRRIHVVSSGQTLTVIDGKRTNVPPNRFDRYKDLLLYRSRPLLHKMLLTHGVDVEMTSLGRYKDRIVYVLGAQYPDESVSQVWIDKESFLPLRWLNVNPNDPNDRLEFIYDQWQKKGELWYPLTVESYHNQHLIRTIHANHIEVNPPLSDELYNISHLVTLYPQVEPNVPPKPSKVDSADEVQQTIEEFQKKFDE